MGSFDVVCCDCSFVMSSSKCMMSCCDDININNFVEINFKRSTGKVCLDNCSTYRQDLSFGHFLLFSAMA